MNDDFFLREKIISKAKARYIPHQTMNITTALSLYLKNDATSAELIPLQVTTVSRPKNWIDKIGRPDCPVCGKALLLRAIYSPKGKQNMYGYQSCWECLHCAYERYSIKSIPDRLSEIDL